MFTVDDDESRLVLTMMTEVDDDERPVSED